MNDPVADGIGQLESRVAWLEKAPERAAKEIDQWKKEMELRDRNTAKISYFAAGGQIYDEKHRKELLFEVARVMKQAKERPGQSIKVGQYRGFGLQVESAHNGLSQQFILEGQAGRYQPMSLSYQTGQEFSINGFIQRLDNVLGGFERNIQDVENVRDHQTAELATARQNLGLAFPHLAQLEALRQDNREVMRELRISQNDPAYKSAWRPKSQGLAEKTPLKGQAAPEITPQRDSGLGR
jgi:hypothetical protein